jgi:hypothetical protein
MIDAMTGRSITSGFYWVRTAKDLYKEFQVKLDLSRDCYGWPHKDRPFDNVQIVYRGTDRDPLTAWGDSDNLAELRLDELEKAGKASDAIIFDLADAASINEFLTGNRTYELIWVREAADLSATPAGFFSCGFEPAWFPGHFSAVCDSMWLPRWHGADEEGIALMEHFKKLNRNGLFDSAQLAEQFLAHYLAFGWAEQPMSDTPNERGAYAIVEVFELATFPDLSGPVNIPRQSRGL